MFDFRVRVTEQHETGDAAKPTLSQAEVPNQTIYETGTASELLCMGGSVLSIGAIVHLGAAGDLGNLPWDGIVQAVILLGAVSGGKSLLLSLKARRSPKIFRQLGDLLLTI